VVVVFARVSILKGVGDRYEEGVVLFRERVVPVLQGQPGFAGTLLLGEPDRGVAFAITLWHSEDAMRASNELGRTLATTAAQQLQAELAMDCCEVAVSELAGLLASGGLSRSPAAAGQ
jgi:hypothetical protein